MLWHLWQYFPICLLQTEHRLYQQLWEALRAKLHHDWLTAPAPLDIICLVYALPTSPLSSHSVMPSWRPNCHDIVDKEMRNELPPTGSSLHEFIQFLVYSNCHLVNCLAATWPLYRSRPSFQNPTWVLCAPVIRIHTVRLVFVACCAGWNEKRSTLHLITRSI